MSFWISVFCTNSFDFQLNFCALRHFMCAAAGALRRFCFSAAYYLFLNASLLCKMLRPAGPFSELPGADYTI